MEHLFQILAMLPRGVCTHRLSRNMPSFIVKRDWLDFLNVHIYAKKRPSYIPLFMMLGQAL